MSAPIDAFGLRVSNAVASSRRNILLHACEAYEDYPEPGRERHLLRMWIAVADERRRPLADSLASRYRWVREGGIPLKP